MPQCHLCENDASEFTCRECEEPVCEDCCVPYDQFNQIDYTLCQCCYDGEQSRRSLEYWKEEEIKEEKDKKRQYRNKLAKNRYWKPENITKRKEERARRKKEAAELAQKHFAELCKRVNSWFK